MIADLVTLAQVLDDTPGQDGRFLARFDVLLKHHEFIATKTRHEIFRPQHGPQAIGHRAQ